MKILKLDRNQLIKKFDIPAYSFTPGCLIMPTLYFDNDTNLFFLVCLCVENAAMLALFDDDWLPIY